LREHYATALSGRLIFNCYVGITRSLQVDSLFCILAKEAVLKLVTDGGPGTSASAIALRCALVFLALLLFLSPAVAQAHPDEEPISAEIVSPATAPEPPATVVKMNDDMPMYSPERLTIKEGETIEWQNLGKVSHSATNNPQLADNPEHALSPPGAETFNSGAVMPGAAFRHTFKIPGRYRYYCLSHEKDKMIGEVTVEPAPKKKTPRKHRENRESPSNHGLMYLPEPAR
jgi:plastocyanin